MIKFKLPGYCAAHLMAMALICKAVTVSAQNISTNANVYIGTSLQVSAGGNVTNNGFFQNNGILSLSGDWINTSVYQGTGTISMEGSDQTLQNNNQHIARIIISGGGTKTFVNKIAIDGELDLLDGIIGVSDADTLLLGESCKVSGGSSKSYVAGALTLTGTGQRIFPIGKNGAYHPATLEDVKGISPVIEMEVQNNLPAIETSPLATVMSDVYWSRKTIAGTFDSSPLALTYSLSDTVDHTRVAIAQGTALDIPFTMLEKPSVQSSAGIDVIATAKEATGNIFAIAELLSDPVKAHFLSTSLSPNAVNPDNRSVKLFGDGLTGESFLFQVFNRWGLSIYETTSMESMKTIGWDGKQQGVVVASGAYPYSLKYLNAGGVLIKQTGFIIVIH